MAVLYLKVPDLADMQNGPLCSISQKKTGCCFEGHSDTVPEHLVPSLPILWPGGIGSHGPGLPDHRAQRLCCLLGVWSRADS